jgi:hypothetical protein
VENFGLGELEPPLTLIRTEVTSPFFHWKQNIFRLTTSSLRIAVLYGEFFGFSESVCLWL